MVKFSFEKAWKRLMSAIGAIYCLNAAPSELDLLQLNSGMSHHGQDGGTIWFDSQCGLVQQQTRLTTESLTEHLPYFNATQQIAIATHSRLFNRQELCQRLSLTADFAKKGDAELIMLSYLKWDLALIDYLVGEFSIILWDAKKSRLICITDHVNSRPIYYYAHDKMLVLASELYSLHQVKDVPRVPNLSKIAGSDFLRVQLEPDETCFAHIKLLPYASMLVRDKYAMSIKRYWQPTLGKCLSFRGENDFAEAFQAMFSTAVQSTTRASGPVCLQLSGGLDSSAIALMAAQTLKRENRHLICLSNVLPSSSIGEDERPFIDLIQAENLVKQEVIDEWRGPFDRLDTFSKHLHTSPQHYQHRALFAAARKHQANIMLHGTLGELTTSSASQEYLAYVFWRGQWLTLLRELFAHKKITKSSMARIIVNHVLRPSLPLFCRRRYSSSHNMLLEMSCINPEFIQQHIPPTQLAWLTEQFIKSSQLSSINPRQNLLAQLNWFLHHTSHLFNSIDDAPNPVVYLSNPYFDKRLIEFCLNVPNEFRFKDGYPRSMIRIGMKNMLPEKIRTRTSKTPFLLDYHQRYNRQIDLMKEALAELSRNHLVQEVINIKQLQQWIGPRSTSSQLNSTQDFINYLVVPRAIYLAKFLSSF